jgi:plasmid stabilization system protein ParE
LKFTFRPRAQADLVRLYAFLEANSPSAAARASALLTEAIGTFDLFPDRNRRAPGGARELIVPFGAGEYVVRYRHVPRRGEIIVHRIWHSRENRG